MTKSRKKTPAKPNPDRQSWPTYFMSLAHNVSIRASCPRAAVGCVLVRANRILATGYNGSPSCTTHCTDSKEDGGGCFMYEGHCVRAVHAEANAIATAAQHGVSLEGATAYLTRSPCIRCFNLLAAAGVEEIVYDNRYGKDLDVIKRLLGPWCLEPSGASYPELLEYKDLVEGFEE